jgi:hypothetical protein
MGHIEPTPDWCTCGNYFNKAMWEAVVKHPVQVELLESPLTTGSDLCRRLIHLKPPASTLSASKEERTRVDKKTRAKPAKSQAGRRASKRNASAR